MVPVHRGPGRPKGSKNKKTLEREAALAAQAPHHRGRPKGSKNKKTLEHEARATEEPGIDIAAVGTIRAI